MRYFLLDLWEAFCWAPFGLKVVLIMEVVALLVIFYGIIFKPFPFTVWW